MSVDNDTMKRGMFIVLEGIDRSGKTTQAHLLVDTLRAADIAAEFARFPRYDTQTGALIQRYLKKEIELDDKTAHLLFCANRTECMEDISSLLRGGITVVCDRYVYSGIAYAAAKGLSYDWCRAIETGLPKPDVVLYFEIEAAEVARRKGFGVDDRHEDVAFLNKVSDAYSDVLARDQFCLRFDATKSVVELALEVAGCVAKQFNEMPLDTSVAQLFVPQKTDWKSLYEIPFSVPTGRRSGSTITDFKPALANNLIPGTKEPAPGVYRISDIVVEREIVREKFNSVSQTTDDDDNDVDDKNSA